MNLLRNIAFSALTAAGIFMAVTYTACNKDECAGVSCEQGAPCSGGSCLCPVGFTGTTCQTENSDSRVKFAKTWTAHWTNIADNTKYGDYSCIVSLNSGVSNAVILDQSFFASYFVHTVNATVSGYNITIPLQSPDGSANSSVQGSGTYNKGQIIWTYTITNSGATKSYTDSWK